MSSIDRLFDALFPSDEVKQEDSHLNDDGFYDHGYYPFGQGEEPKAPEKLTREAFRGLFRQALLEVVAEIEDEMKRNSPTISPRHPLYD